ncbi:MAG: tetratricopeptide repeat protein [Bacteroidota bacterium]|nr:tetratricopeptide repeat protein [Bacteroidota bacterium]
MCIRRLLYLTLLALLPQFIWAQEMTEGFKKMEAGDFAGAKSFFAEILRKNPENKTATICYGRSVGLDSSPSEAKEIFLKLLQNHPEDREVQLNYAESLIWNKDYEAAEHYYAEMIQENEPDFKLMLGYANSLSNLKKYGPAQEWIQKALQLQPDDPGALNSLKYIRLGKAYSLSQEKLYINALKILQENLAQFPGDQESLLSQANIYLLQKETSSAIHSFKEMAVTRKDSILAHLGIAVCYHEEKKENKALDHAENAFLKSKTEKDGTLVWRAQERLVQALLWNARYQKAQKMIGQLQENYGNTNQVLALHAAYGMYTGDFRSSIADYREILRTEASSFDANLGLANAYFANGNIAAAKNAGIATLKLFPGQSDAQKLMEKIEELSQPEISETRRYSFDNGHNESVSLNTTVKWPLNSRFSIGGNYTYRNTQNNALPNSAESNQLSIAAEYRLPIPVSFQLKGGLMQAQTEDPYTAIIGEISTQIAYFRRNHLSLGYRRDVQDFNADLLQQRLVGNHFFISDHYRSLLGLGWYFQFQTSSLSDENQRNLLYSSIYYQLLKKLKLGINYQYISFQEQRPKLYFSRGQYQSAEIFLNLVQSDNEQRFQYDLTAALGYQFIEEQARQGTYRFQANFLYDFSKSWRGGLFGNHSSMASATALGFSFTEFGLSLRYRLQRNQ